MNPDLRVRSLMSFDNLKGSVNVGLMEECQIDFKVNPESILEIRHVTSMTLF
jgi:hypothetical protein